MYPTIFVSALSFAPKHKYSVDVMVFALSAPVRRENSWRQALVGITKREQQLWRTFF